MEPASKMVENLPSELPHISVVIPAHNEAKNLPYVLLLIPGWVHEIILVDDHSTDNTVEVARRLFPSIRITRTQHKCGKGEALRVGFAAATSDIIVMMDADGSSDPREIPRFIEALMAGAYFATGSRFIDGGGSTDITHLRRFGAHMLISITNRLFRAHFTDMFCGLNAFWKDCLNFFEIDCEGFDVETLLILRACKANLEIVGVPSHEHARIHGTTHFRTFRDGWRVLMMIVKEWMKGRSVVGTIKIHHPTQQDNGEWGGLYIWQSRAMR
ncbi:MAG TPA: glycosyltransferase family 2 protein [Ktedonobacteraceae bacterium]|nr:glycosyltransferase family 2 protein [Ktedonobacteraceae bacterium]